jgi:pimeloyl-ACP methyl ester carboxylesterase
MYFGAFFALFVLVILPIKSNAAEIISKTATTTTIRFYSGSGDGNLWSNAKNWDTMHSQSIYYDQGNEYTEIGGWVSSQFSNSSLRIGVSRSFLPFNTAELPDEAEIYSAKLGIFIPYHNNNDLDGYNFITVVKTSQATTSRLSADDIDQCGAISNPMEGVSTENRISLNGVEDGEYHHFELNEIGLSWIDKVNQLDDNDNTKGTLLGLREGHDALNHELEKCNVLGNCLSRILVYFSESGTSTAPYLDVTYKTVQVEDPLDPVILVPGILGSWKVGGEWQVDPILDTYDNIVSAMTDSGYELDKNLFLFPYDWRNDNRDTAVLLKEKIDDITQGKPSEKVDIVAHSMGGLVARSYLQSNQYDDDIDQLIFLGTPQTGAPEAYLAYENGTINGFSGPIAKFLFDIEAELNGYKDLPEYIRERVRSTEQLLPVYDYLMDFSKGDWTMRSYPADYPRNIFLEELNQTDSLGLAYSRANLYSFYGDNDKDNTIEAIKLKNKRNLKSWMHGKVNDLVKGEGDGTVPSASLSYLEDSSQKLFESTNHREIVTESQADVIKTLTGEDPDNHFASAEKINNYLFIRVYSPVDFQVIGPDDRWIGKDFENNSQFNDYSNAFYSGFDTEAEFVMIPNFQAGEYRVILQGVANGSYKLAVDTVFEDGQENGDYMRSIIRKGEIVEYLIIVTADRGVKMEKVQSCGLISKDIEDYYASGEIRKNAAMQFLSAKFKNICDEDGYSDEAYENNRELVNKMLENYLEKNWISELVHDDLWIED